MKYQKIGDSDTILDNIELGQVSNASNSITADKKYTLISPGLFYGIFQDLVKDGESSVISKTNMLDLPPSLTSRKILADFVKHYSEYSNKSTRTGTKPPVFWILHSQIFHQFYEAGIYRLLNDILVMLSTYSIKLIISAAHDQNLCAAAVFATILTLSSLLQALFLQRFINGAFLAGSTVVSTTTSAVFYSTLCMRLHKADPPKSIGEINSIQSKDSSALRDFVVFAHNLWACPLTIIMCVALLIHMLGFFAGAVSFIMLILLMPVETYVAKNAKKARKAVMKFSDERMAFINEVIDGIRTVKLSNMVYFVYEKVTKLRANELNMIWRGMMIELTNTLITRSASLLITLITFAVYSLTSYEPLSADRAFTALVAISTLNRPLFLIPKCITMLTEAWVSCSRIDSIMNEGKKYDATLFTTAMLAESNSYFSSPKPPPSSGSDHMISLERTSGYRVKVQKKNAKGKPQADIESGADRESLVPVLHSVTSLLRQPGLVLVVGDNGSGKTSLLLAMLHELLLSRDASMSILPLDSIVAYSGHDPWIVNASARENIILAAGGSASDSGDGFVDNRKALELSPQERYAAAVHSCALEQDFAAWKDGDETIIGEKGINISGGQRQRLSLARALFSPAHILLLDSTLTGLDVAVSLHVFKEAVLMAAKTRLVVLSTLNHDFLSYADHIIGISEGSLIFDGTYDNLVSVSSDVKLKLGINTTLKAAAVTATLDSSLNPYADPFADFINSQTLVEGAVDVPQAEILSVKKPAVASSFPSSSSSSSVVAGGKRDDITANTSVLRSIQLYVNACGPMNLIFALVFTLSAYFLSIVIDYQLTYWTDGVYSATQYFVIYGILSGGILLFNFGRYFQYKLSGITASRVLHDRLVSSVLNAAFSFFDTTPSGRITSRFASDFDAIDFDIPEMFVSVVDAYLGVLSGVIVVVISVPYYTILLAPLLYQYSSIQRTYRIASKQLKKLDSGAKSPLYSHFREVLNGLETIRAYRIEKRVCDQHHDLLDFSIRARLNWDLSNRWMSLRLDIIGSLIVSAAAFSVVYAIWSSPPNSSGDTGESEGQSLLVVRFTSGVAGMILSYALKVTVSFTFAIRASTALENLITAQERVDEYISDIPHETSADEPPLHSSSIPLLALRPSVSGGGDETILRARGLYFRYSPSLPFVLKGVDFELKPGRLIAVVGRTGCGKSTLSLVLSRALTPGVHSIEGAIDFFGRDFRQVPLREYRDSVQTFPQNSYIFSGRLRDIIDPAGLYDDAKLLRVLSNLGSAVIVDDAEKAFAEEVANGAEAVAASAKVTYDQKGSIFDLDLAVATGGRNLSAGQAQVIALARAALCKADSVVILDEITSNMDAATAVKAINVLKEELLGGGSNTNQRRIGVVMIAHSMADVKMCDDVWVMVEGRIVEAGPINELAAKPDGFFASMISSGGGAEDSSSI